jgi:hypothetical protein
MYCTAGVLEIHYGMPFISVIYCTAEVLEVHHGMTFISVRTQANGVAALMHTMHVFCACVHPQVPGAAVLYTDGGLRPDAFLCRAPSNRRDLHESAEAATLSRPASPA